ncbi:MAG: DUF177 domain-containing protein [Actinomycetota bacterium]
MSDEFKLSVAEILGRPAAYREVELRAPIGGVESAVARLAEDPISARLRLEAVVEGILVTGGVQAGLRLECARCLKDFKSDIAVEVCDLYAAAGSSEDAYRLSGTDLNLEPLLRDVLGLALPFNPLCRPDCKGLCAQCGKDLNAGPCDCKTDERDPRWDALDAVAERLRADTSA